MEYCRVIVTELPPAWLSAKLWYSTLIPKRVQAEPAIRPNRVVGMLVYAPVFYAVEVAALIPTYSIEFFTSLLNS